MTDTSKSAGELLPCPFCGESDVGFGRTGQKWQTVACNECGAEGPCTEIDRDFIIKRWNTRSSQAGAETLQGQIAAVYGNLDAEDCARIDREWMKMRGIRAGADGGVREALEPTEEMYADARLAAQMMETYHATGDKTFWMAAKRLAALASPVPAMPDREKIEEIVYDYGYGGATVRETVDTLHTLLSAQQPVATERDVREISDEDMRDLLSAKDVGSGRAKLKRILHALSQQPRSEERS